MTALPALAPAGGAPAHLTRHRIELSGGAATTLHVAAYALDATRVRVVRLRRPMPLEAWCARSGVGDAIVGGFFTRPGGRSAHAVSGGRAARPDVLPLGELRTGGLARRSIPFDAPWGDVRACVHAHAGDVTIGRRDALPGAPRGDLLQAGPLLVVEGRIAIADGHDPEGFSAGERQFDSDNAAGRHPRAALARTADGRLLAVAADGRADDDAGLTLEELAAALLRLGARAALNLDGGGSTSLVCDGRLQNVPREGHGVALPGGRAIATALAFVPR
jgi:hypothetical protein